MAKAKPPSNTASRGSKEASTAGASRRAVWASLRQAGEALRAFASSKQGKEFAEQLEAFASSEQYKQLERFRRGSRRKLPRHFGK